MTDHILNLDQVASHGADEEIVQVTVAGYRYAIYPHKALVFKGDAIKADYTVDRENGCDCKSATLGGRVCKHMQALSWFSDGDEILAKPVDNGMVDLSGLLLSE